VEGQSNLVTLKDINKDTIETSNNPDSTFDIVRNPSLYQRRIFDGNERYTNNASIEVNGSNKA